MPDADRTRLVLESNNRINVHFYSNSNFTLTPNVDATLSVPTI